MIEKMTKILIQEDVVDRMGAYFERNSAKMFSFIDYEKKRKAILSPLLKKYTDPTEIDFLHKIAPIQFLAEFMSDDLSYHELDNVLISLIPGKVKGVIQVFLKMGQFRRIPLDLYTINITRENKLKLVSIIGKSKIFDMKSETISQTLMDYIKTDGLNAIRDKDVQHCLLTELQKQMKELFNKFTSNNVIEHYNIPLSLEFDPKKITFNSVSEERVIDFHIIVNNQYQLNLSKASIHDILNFAERDLSVMAEKIGLQKRIEVNKENKKSDRL